MARLMAAWEAEASWFPGRLRELRQEKGLTQPQLAKRAEISTRQVSRLETGEQVATWPTVLRLAHALRVKVTAFLKPAAGWSTAHPCEKGRTKRGRPKKARGEKAASQ